MLQVEYVRNLNCNYERILLDKKPEEKRYQYCILSRGGIKGLLPCSLRYINGQAYLYYDISSRQNVAQLFGNKAVSREWVKDFVWNICRIRTELERFLLDSGNILWFPEQIFQDLESNVFSFLYVPYYEGESGILKLMEFLIDHIDYGDEMLVECVYGMYEQLERNGEVYLQAQIYEDIKRLERQEEKDEAADADWERTGDRAAADKTDKEEAEGKETGRKEAWKRETAKENTGGSSRKKRELIGEAAVKEMTAGKEIDGEENGRGEKKGFLSIFEGKRKRIREQKENYIQAMQQEMTGCAVAEDTSYEEEPYGRTIFMEEKSTPSEGPHRLFAADGKLLATLDKSVFCIGKKKEDVDLLLEDPSVSRIHARIIQDKSGVYLEDINSTNGTCKNGLRLLPYEKKELEEGDEIKCGTVVMIFR